MSWRVVVISSLAKLDYKMDYLVVRTRDEVKRIHLSEISVLIIESTAVSLTAYLMSELLKRKVDVLFCDEKRLPQGMLHALYGSHDTSLKFREQIHWKQKSKDAAWAEIIYHKILGQVTMLQAAKKNGTQLLLSYLPQIEPADSTNREGHAAKVYFNALFGMDFTRTQNNTINAALDFGYSILLSAFAREVVACGHATQLGLFHNNMFNHFNLASDLMEPFRPYIDHAVYLLDHSKFEHNEKLALVHVLNREVLLNGKEQYMINAIRIYVKSVLDAVAKDDMTEIQWPDYELSIYENDTVF